MYYDGLDAGMLVLMLQFRRRVHRIDIDPCGAGPQYAKHRPEAAMLGSMTAIRSPTRPNGRFRHD
jgi:hypothetical protein